jgi:hypothetical protein
MDPQSVLADPELVNLLELKRLDSWALEVAVQKLLGRQTGIFRLIRSEIKNGE